MRPRCSCSFAAPLASASSRPLCVALPDGQDDQVRRQGKLSAGFRDDRAIGSGRQLDQLNPFHGFAAEYARGLHMPQELHSLEPGVLVLKGKGRHLLLAAAIDDVHIAGAQPDRSNGGVDGGVSRSDDDHARRHARELPGLVAGDQIEGVGHARQLFAGDAKLVDCAQPNAQEDGIVVALEVRQHLGVDHGLEVKLHSELGEHFDFAQAFDQGQFVFGDAVGVQASG